MQGGRDPFFNFGDPFASFGDPFASFGGQRSLFSSFFGGRDPFDDPFFTRPFGSVFESSFFGPSRSPFMDAQASGFLEHQPSQPPRSRGPVIEELNSDDEREEKDATEEKKENSRKHRRSSKEPIVEDPDDAPEERKSKQLQFRNDYNRVNNMRSQPQAHNFTFQSSTVTYGGANGAYYSSSTTRRSGSDGFNFEESKEANSATGQASHRVSRGIHEKGHSVFRKLNSDGRVDSMQALHNLNEDELAAFDKNWEGNARKHLPGWNERLIPHQANGSGSSAPNRSSRGGWALPSTERSSHPGTAASGTGGVASVPRPQYAGRARTDVGNKVGSSSHGRSRAPNLGNKNQAGRG